MTIEPVTPELEFGFAGAIDARLRELRTWQPGVMLEYDPTTQRGVAQPIVREIDQDENDNRVTSLPPPVQVLVSMPGSGKNRVTFPVAAGDFVILLFCEVSLDKWKEVGGTDVDPGDPRRHSLSDAIAIPGLFNFSAVPTEAPTDASVWWGDLIKLGDSGASDAVLKGDAFLTALDTLIDAIATAVSTSGNPPGATAAGTAITTAKGVFDAAASTYKSNKVKVG
jgi:hypothetical protein